MQVKRKASCEKKKKQKNRIARPRNVEIVAYN